MKKTKEDIYVVKELFITGGKIFSPIMGFEWEFDKTYEISLKEIKKNVKKYYKRQEWYNGFHSYSMEAYFIHIIDNEVQRLPEYKAVIPKGSYVVYGIDGCILSNKLMLLNEKL